MVVFLCLSTRVYRIDAVFLGGSKLLYQLAPKGYKIVFGQTGIILKHMDLKICSSFFFSKIIRKKWEKSTLKIPCLIDINWRRVKTLLF